jgi:hypothetical protein
LLICDAQLSLAGANFVVVRATTPPKTIGNSVTAATADLHTNTKVSNMKNLMKAVVLTATLVASANAYSQSVSPAKPIYPMNAGSGTGEISVEQALETPIKFHLPNGIGETAQAKAEGRLVIQPFLGGPNLRKQSIQSLIEPNRLIVDFSIYSAMARSGRVFLLEKVLETQSGKTLVTFTPKEVTNYQFGLIKFDLPKISTQDLYNHVKTAKLQIRLEINSEFPAEATIATLLS